MPCPGQSAASGPSEPSVERIRTRLDSFERRAVPAGSDLRRAAVAVVLLHDGNGQLCFVLTRRAESLRKHGGQWALPGGKIDEGENHFEAVRREAHEEVGLAVPESGVLGLLDDYVTRSGFAITPIILYLAGSADLQPNPQEVAQAYKVPVADLDRPEVPILYDIPESDRPVLCMPILGDRVHAPTAALLYQFLEVCVRNNSAVRVAHYEQPVFAWK